MRVCNICCAFIVPLTSPPLISCEPALSVCCFVASIISVLFCWQVEYKSNIGFVTMYYGVRCCHSWQKREQLTARAPSDSKVIQFPYVGRALCSRRGEAEGHYTYKLECALAAELHFPLHSVKQTAQTAVCQRVKWYYEGGTAHGFEVPDRCPSTWL